MSRVGIFLASFSIFAEKGTIEDNLGGKRRMFGACGFKTVSSHCNEVPWSRPTLDP